MKKLDINGYSFVHFTLILLLHYLVKCRSPSLAVYNNKFILVAHASAQKIIVRPQNHWKNDRRYVPTATKNRYINAIRPLKTRSNFSKSVMMVSVALAVSSLGASNIHVLEPGVKINGVYYRDVVLRLMLLPDIRAASGSEFFVFQQVNVPSHRAKDYSSAAGPALWPPNWPDLNPVDYTMWSVLQERSIVPRSRTSTNWNDASTVNGPLWVTRLLNVLLASGVSVYALAFVLEVDILSTCCNKDDVMWHVWLFWETITASRVCRYSVNHLMYV